MQALVSSLLLQPVHSVLWPVWTASKCSPACWLLAGFDPWETLAGNRKKEAKLFLSCPVGHQGLLCPPTEGHRSFRVPFHSVSSLQIWQPFPSLPLWAQVRTSPLLLSRGWSAPNYYTVVIHPRYLPWGYGGIPVGSLQPSHTFISLFLNLCSWGALVDVSPLNNPKQQMPLPSSWCYRWDTEGQRLNELSKSQSQAMVAPVFEPRQPGSRNHIPYYFPRPGFLEMWQGQELGWELALKVIMNLLWVSVAHIFGEGLQWVWELQTQMPAGVKKWQQQGSGPGDCHKETCFHLFYIQHLTLLSILPLPASIENRTQR